MSFVTEWEVPDPLYLEKVSDGFTGNYRLSVREGESKGLCKPTWVPPQEWSSRWVVEDRTGPSCFFRCLFHE